MRRLLLVPVVLACGACGEDGSDPCPANGFRFEVELDPDPPCVCQNRLHLRLTDSAGQPVAGASVTVDPQMPIHGHGSTQVPEVEALGEGRYEAWPMTLIMSGPWEIFVRIEVQGRSGCYQHHVDVP